MLNIKHYLNILRSPAVISFYWEGSFKFKEKIIINRKDVFNDLERFAEREKKKLNMKDWIINELLYYVPTRLLK